MGRWATGFFLGRGLPAARGRVYLLSQMHPDP